MGYQPDACGVGTARQRLQRERIVSAQYLSGVAGGAWCLRFSTLCVADVGAMAAGTGAGSLGRARGVSESAVSCHVARDAWHLLGECGSGGDELPVRKRASVLHGWDAGGAAAARG